MNAYVIGSGPNGLTAAIVLMRAGFNTTILEAQDGFGGGLRSAELTLPGFMHDVCSAVHPLAVASPVFAGFPLAEHGLEWIQPPLPVVHAFHPGQAVVVHRSLDQTAKELGADGPVYRRVLGPLVRRWRELTAEVLDPPHWPRHPLLMAQFGLLALQAAEQAARLKFKTAEARAMFGGLAAHSMLPLEKRGSAAFGWLLLAAAHSVGWPIPRGGSQSIANALISYFESLGGVALKNTKIRSLTDLPRDGPIMCDVGPRQLLELAGNQLPDAYAAKLRRYRYGPGVFKLDWALKTPIPWRSTNCARSGTVHIGGALEDVAEAERAPWKGETAARPFIILTQPSVFDASRVRGQHHTAWAYCHVPSGSREDMSERIEYEVERHAFGFRAAILKRAVRTTAELERHNANLVGGEISGGAMDLKQLLVRPTLSYYRTPLRRVFLCSASTPPGAGVHGMCGYHAARIAIKLEQ